MTPSSSDGGCDLRLNLHTGQARSQRQRVDREGVNAVGHGHHGPIGRHHRHEAGLADALQVHHGPEGSERRLRLGQLALPQLDLDGGPSAVVKLDDEVDLLAVGIAVVVDPACTTCDSNQSPAVSRSSTNRSGEARMTATARAGSAKWSLAVVLIAARERR